MELRHLTHFVAVAEERSFTRASLRLHIAQSAVSASIRGLEHELGVELFERTTQQVKLAAAGEALLPEARRTLAAATAAREAAEAVGGGLRGTLRIGTMQALRIVDLPRVLADFRHAYPLVELRVRHAGGGSAQLADQVRAGELDLAVLAAHERRVPGLQLTTLASEKIELACRPDHRLAGRKSIDLADIAQETFVDFPAGWGLRTATDLAFASARVGRTVTMEVDDVLELARLVAGGLGIALMPRWIAADADLRTVPIRHHAPVHEVAVAIPSTRRPSAPARTLLKAILEQRRRAPGRGRARAG